MKLVRGVSLFIVCIGLFIIGCFLGFNGHSFFYPGDVLPQENMIPDSSGSAGLMPVSAGEENIITADTSFIVIEVNAEDQSEIKEEIPVPTYYMGMDRESFEKQIEMQNDSPSLTELKKGFQNSEIRSFSGKRVEVCKYYQKQEKKEDDFFYLAIMDNQVVVYKADGITVYMETDISADELPEDILQELLQRRVVNTEEELYDFLESYSS